jgi:hypothetical protein
MKRWFAIVGLCSVLVLCVGAAAGASAAGVGLAAETGVVGADTPPSGADVPPGVEPGAGPPTVDREIPEPVELTDDTGTIDEQVSTSASATIQGELLVNRTPSTIGTVEVTYEVTIPDDVVDFYAYLNGSLSQSFSVTGTSGFSYSSSKGRWEASSPQGSTTTASLTYSVDANSTSSFGGYNSVETNDWALVGFGQLSVSQSWRYFNSPPTYEETTTVDGPGYGGGGRAFLGPVSTSTRSVTGQTVTLVVPDAANPVRSQSNLADDLANVSEFLQVGDRDDRTTAIVAPDPIRGGGRGGGSAFWVQENSTRTVHLHEYIHTRQAWLDGDLPASTDSTVEFLTEASADYYQGYLAWDVLGIFDDSEFYNYASTTVKENAVLQDSDSDAAERKNYNKGRRVLTALDIRIRQNTDGNRTLAAVFESLNAENGSFSYSDLRNESIALTNQSTGSWLDTYVTTSAVPSIPQDIEAAYYPGDGPPTVESVALVDASDGDGLVNGSDSIEITATVTDADGIGSVTADATGFGAGSVTLTDSGPNSSSADDQYSATAAVDAAAPEGAQSVSVDATDIDGNGGSQAVASGSLTVDTTPPSVSDVTVVDDTDANGIVNGSDSVEITATVTDANGIVSVTADASGFGAGTVTLADSGPNSSNADDQYSVTVAVDSGASEGAKSISVDATDELGNGGGQTVSSAGSVTVDTTTPTISGFSVGNPEGQNVSVSFDSSESLADILVSIGGAESGTLVESEFTENSGTYTAVYQGTSSGDYTATLETATDPAGNDGASGRSDTVTIEGSVDRVELSPSADQSITAGGAIDFEASAFDSQDNLVDDTDSNFSWAGEGGQINTSGYFDETTAGVYNVTATLNGVSNETRVTVRAGSVDRVELSPGTDQSITAGGTVPFDATAFDSEDNLVDDTDSNFSWAAEGGSITSAGLFDETSPGTYNVTATLDGVASNPVTVTVSAGEPNVPNVDIRSDGAQLTAIVAGDNGDVLVDVENQGQTAASFELSMSFEAPDDSTIGDFPTVTTPELSPNTTTTIRFEDVLGNLTAVGFYDVVITAEASGEQFTSTDALAVSVDVDDNGNAAADAENGPAKFDGMFDSVSGQSNDELSIVDVVALFERFDSDVVDDNAEYFRFANPDATDPDRVGIADVVALFDQV